MGNLSLPTRVPHDVGRGVIRDGLFEDRNMDSISEPLLNPGVPGTAGSIVVDRHARDDVVTIHSFLTAFQQDAPRFDDRGDDQVQHTV